MAESVLMRALLKLYVRDFEGDDDRCPQMTGRSRTAERRAFTLLSSVCWYWRQTLTGWPQSSTRRWFRHQLKKQIERKYTMVLCGAVLRSANLFIYLFVYLAKSYRSLIALILPIIFTYFVIFRT